MSATTVTNAITATQANDEALRKHLWIQVAISVVACENCSNKETAGVFANKALDDYDKRFNTKPQ